LVFETYKADWETFPPADNEGRPLTPHQWNNWLADWGEAHRSCHGAAGDFFLAPSTKDYGPDYHPTNFRYFDNVSEFGFEKSVLVAQNGTLVRYLAAYNQIEFNQILVKEWFLAKRLPHSGTDEPVVFLDGSLSVKSAWVDMAKVGPPPIHYTIRHPETFHRIKAWLYDPYTHTCERHIMGLVGLHIVHKTPLRQQWVWSSFEHVDNVPPDVQSLPNGETTVPDPSCPTPSNPMSRYTFNDGTRTPMQNMLFPLDQLFAANCPPAPVNIARNRPINRDADVVRSTKDTNAIWQTELKKRNSVWQYYQLVMTQWPIGARKCGSGPCGTPMTTAPGSGPGQLEHSAFANTTLETWSQTELTTGCMSCHGFTQNDHVDFVWSLLMNAYPPGQSRASSLAVKALQDLLTKREVR
jgi:hypothetical protein